MNPLPDQTAGWTWDGGIRPQGKLIEFAPFPIGRSQPLVHARVNGTNVVEDGQRLEQHPKLQVRALTIIRAVRD